MRGVCGLLLGGGRFVYRDVVRPSRLLRFCSYTQPSSMDVEERMSDVEERMSAFEGKMRDVQAGMIRLEGSLNAAVESLKATVATVESAVKVETSAMKTAVDELQKKHSLFHMEWCQRDLSVVAAEVLKWSVGARSSSDGDGRQFYVPSRQRDVQIGAQVFKRSIEDYKDFSRLVIMERNHQVHFASLKSLDARVDTALRYLEIYGDYLRLAKPKEVEVVEHYMALKKALPIQFK